MKSMNLEIATHLEAYSNVLHEQSYEFPERAARNEAAAKELDQLAVLFDNDDTDPELLQEFTDTLGEIDFASTRTQSYDRVLNGVGFHKHYETAEDFLIAALREMDPSCNR